MKSKSFALIGRLMLLFALGVSFLLGCIRMPAQAVESEVGSAQNERRTTEIPFSFPSKSAPRIVIYLRINSSKRMPFLLVTGYSGSIIFFKWSASALRLKPISRVSKSKHPVSFETAILKSVEFTSLKSGFQFTIINLPVELKNWNPKNVRRPSIAGLMGCSLFSNGALSVDFDRKTLTLSPTCKIPQGAREGVVMDLHSKSGGRVSAKLTLGDSDIWGLLDTGSEISTFPDKILSGIGELKSTGVRLERIVGFEQTTLFRVSGIVFGEETIPTINVASAGTGQAIIGLDILSKFNFSLDYAKRQLHLYTRNKRELKRGSR